MGSRRIASFVSFAAMFAACVVAQGRTNGTCRIRARIVAENGKAIAGAGAVFGIENEITTNDALKSPAARSDANGVLDFAAPVPAAFFTPTVLLIAAPGRVAFRVPHPERTSRERFKVLTNVDLGDVRLPPGHTLTGRVRDAEGKPIANAFVTGFDELYLQPRSWPAFASCTRTNGDGVFALPGVFATATAIEVECAGHFTETRVGVAIGTPLEVRLTPSGFVDGTARDSDGKPLAGRVSCTYQLDERANAVTAAADGTFRVPLAHRGPLRLGLFAPDSSCVAESEILDGPCAGITLRAEDDSKRFVVRAKAKDSGEPVRSLRVAIFWWPNEAPPPSLQAALEVLLAPSRPDGGVPIAAPDSRQGSKGHVLVRADGFAPLFASGIDHREGSSFVAELERESRISGRVVDRKREPVAGITVTCTRSAYRDGTGASLPTAWGTPCERAVTGADGTFTFRGLAAESYVIEARWPDGTAIAARSAKPPSGEELANHDLQLPEGATVRVRVTGVPDDADWRLVLAAEAPADAAAGWIRGRLAPWNVAGAHLAKNGVVEFERRAQGKETVWLLVPQSPRQGSTIVMPVTEVDVGAFDSTVEVDLANHRPGSIVSKVVVRDREIPPSRLVVVATKQGEPPRTMATLRALDRHWAMVEPDGSFALALPPGDHEIALVDVATNLFVHRAGNVHVTAGRVLNNEIRCELAEVRVSFERGPDERWTAPFLRLESGRQSWGERAMFGSSPFGFAGCSVTSIDDRFSFFAEPGDLKMSLCGGATSMRLGARSFDSFTMKDATTVEVTADKPNEVTLKMPLPIDLRGK